MVEKTKKVWMNGEIIDWDDAKVHVLTHTLHYGLGAFEGIRCYKCDDGSSAIFRLKEHTRRLFESLKIIAMEMPFSEEEINNACIKLIQINNLKECYIRPIVYCGEGAMGLFAENPTQAAIIVWPWGAYLGDEALQKGIRAKISSFNRHHVNVGMVRGKIMGQYVSSILAKREAMALGFDEAILLDVHGYVAEASGENIFAIRDGVIYTPPDSSPILAGITRDSVIHFIRDLALPFREEAFTRDFLYICDEVFLTGTAAEVTPVVEIDCRKIGEGTPGPVTRKIQEMYLKTARGANKKYQHWLTKV